MSEQPPGPSSEDELPGAPAAPPQPAPERSPWSRDYAGPPLRYEQPEPRFAGQPGTQQPVIEVPGQPYAPPSAGYAPPEYAPPGQGDVQTWQLPGLPPPRRSGSARSILVALLVVVLIAGLTTVLLTSGSKKSSASGDLPIPGALASPTPGSGVLPTPSPSQSVPANPLPSLGLIATPPALLAIGYHAYSSTLLAPSDIALGPQELVEFKKYGLQRTVSMQALTLGSTATTDDDYQATINVLKFSSASGAKAELNYSNTQNSKQAPTTPLPGFPDATAFYNKATSTTGISIGAFTTTGSYQVVVILGGLPDNDSTNESAFSAEAARVLRAVLPIAGTIEPEAASGTSPQNPAPQNPAPQTPAPQAPGLVTPSPTGTHA